MSRLYPEYLDPTSFRRPMHDDLFLRQEPDEYEEEDDDEDEVDDEENDDEDGYSE